MKLFIADPNERIRQYSASLAACVEGIEIVGEAGDVQEAIGGIKRAKPDSVIVALQLSGGTGFDVLSAAKPTDPSIVIMMLTIDERPEYRLESLALGADYFFEKSHEIKKIITTLVLLAHRSYQEKIEVRHEVAVPRLLPSMTVARIAPLNSPASYPRTALTPISMHCVYFFTGDASHIKSKLVLSQTPASRSRFPP
jgi:DNA-binding NarL/FixJ family response regulator